VAYSYNGYASLFDVFAGDFSGRRALTTLQRFFCRIHLDALGAIRTRRKGNRVRGISQAEYVRGRKPRNEFDFDI
jgi:hypothetical protein